MTGNISKQRIYAGLLFLGAGILLFRTIRLISQGAFEYLVLWVFVLLIAELLLDLGCMIYSARWWLANDTSKDRIPLRLGAAATILHAVRVLIFVIGRLGPWINFDVRPEHIALHHTRWQMFWVYFAAIKSVLGIVGVVLIWRLRRRRQRYGSEVSAT